MHKKVSILNVPIQNISLPEAVSALIREAGSDGLTQAAFVNADCLNIATRHTDYRKLLNEIPLVFGDGSGIRYASKMIHAPVKDNVNGTDLFPLVCERAAEEGLSIYLLGGKPGVSAKVAERVLKRYPTLNIAGYADGYFSEEETPEVITKVNSTRPDILIVAMGAPKQELWIHKHRDALDCNLALGVGGLFDFAAKEVGRAPMWVRRLGMEWVVRLLKEPFRLMRRYLIGNPLFLWRCYRQRCEGAADRIKVNDAKQEMTETPAVKRHFDIWRDFEILDEVEMKYSSLAHAKGLKKALSLKERNKRRWLVKTNFFVRAKRFLDISSSFAALLIFSPLFAVTALAIYIDNPGPVFFRQSRVGRYGKLFSMLKFRSMVVNADRQQAEITHLNESAAGVLFKMKRDPRITRVGSFIRKFSIDELPQLINVLKGDMSLVGPRPPLPAEVDLYSLQQRRRLDVLPGITCIWQVSGRSDIDFVGQVELDLKYINLRSILQDIKILINTIPAVLKARGAY